MINPAAKLAANIFEKDKLEQKPTRDGYGDALVAAGQEDPNIVVLTGDLAESTRSLNFQKQFPERFFECGVAEQNMMGIAAGLAMAGKIPFISTYGVFCPGRNWDQLRVNVCYNDANVKLTGAHTGVSVGPDGATHQALEDIAITRCLPNLTVLAPCDYWETKKATLAAAKMKGPLYLRFAREKTAVFTTEATPFEIGRAQYLYWPENGKPEVAIIACGPLTYRALMAARELAEEGIIAGVVNNATIKPMDEKIIIEAARAAGAAVTVEDHQIMGGMGSAVAEVLVKNYPVPMEFVGMLDRFGESGEPDELIARFKMDLPDIKAAVKKVLARKEKAHQD